MMSFLETISSIAIHSISKANNDAGDLQTTDASVTTTTESYEPNVDPLAFLAKTVIDTVCAFIRSSVSKADLVAQVVRFPS
jgi:hypothetical protein